MHELRIASSIVDAVQAEMSKRPSARVVNVGIRVGDIAGVDAEALRFGFSALIQETDLGPVGLEIEKIPYLRVCRTCGVEFRVDDFAAGCPDCGAVRTGFVSGDELEIAFLEVEEP
jgi:hydrogenase nickel incorporation protein HypA/HybF